MPSPRTVSATLGRVAFARAVARQPVGGHQRARRDLLPDLHAHLRADDVGERAVAGRHLAVVGRDGAEVLLDPAPRLLRVDVADDRQDRVVRRVVRTEERARVVQRHRVQIGHGADGRVVVRVALGIGQRGHPLERGAVGHVVVALPALVLDHVTLVFQDSSSSAASSEPIRSASSQSASSSWCAGMISK